MVLEDGREREREWGIRTTGTKKGEREGVKMRFEINGLAREERRENIYIERDEERERERWGRCVRLSLVGGGREGIEREREREIGREREKEGEREEREKWRENAMRKNAKGSTNTLPSY